MNLAVAFGLLRTDVCLVLFALCATDASSPAAVRAACLRLQRWSWKTLLYLADVALLPRKNLLFVSSSTAPC